MQILTYDRSKVCLVIFDKEEAVKHLYIWVRLWLAASGFSDYKEEKKPDFFQNKNNAFPLNVCLCA